MSDFRFKFKDKEIQLRPLFYSHMASTENPTGNSEG